MHLRFTQINTLTPPKSAVTAMHVFCRFAATVARLYNKMHRHD